MPTFVNYSSRRSKTQIEVLSKQKKGHATLFNSRSDNVVVRHLKLTTTNLTSLRGFNTYNPLADPGGNPAMPLSWFKGGLPLYRGLRGLAPLDGGERYKLRKGDIFSLASRVINSIL